MEEHSKVPMNASRKTRGRRVIAPSPSLNKRSSVKASYSMHLLNEGIKNLEMKNKKKQHERIMTEVPVMPLDEVKHFEHKAFQRNNYDSFMELQEKRKVSLADVDSRAYHSRLSIAAMEAGGKHKPGREHDRRHPAQDIEIVADLINQVERSDAGDLRLRRHFVQGGERRRLPSPPAGGARPAPAAEGSPLGFGGTTVSQSRSEAALVLANSPGPTQASPMARKKKSPKEKLAALPAQKDGFRSLLHAYLADPDGAAETLSLAGRSGGGDGGGGARDGGPAPADRPPPPPPPAAAAEAALRVGGRRRRLSAVARHREGRLGRADQLVALAAAGNAGPPPLSREEVATVVEFMDKDGDGEIAVGEFEAALKAARQRARADLSPEVGAALVRIDDRLRLGHLRAKDLFAQFDRDGGGSLCREELAEGLHMLCADDRAQVLEERRRRRAAAAARREEDAARRARAMNFLQSADPLPEEVLGGGGGAGKFRYQRGDPGAGFEALLARAAREDPALAELYLDAPVPAAAPEPPPPGGAGAGAGGEGGGGGRGRRSSGGRLQDAALARWQEEDRARRRAFLERYGAADDEETRLLRQTAFEEALLPNLYRERGKGSSFAYYVRDEQEAVLRSWMRIPRAKRT